MIIGSHAVTGWWQAALLGFGISLLVVGTVELGIIGLIKKLTESDNESSKDERSMVIQVDDGSSMIIPVNDEPSMDVSVVSTETTATLPDIAAILRELASRLEVSTAEVIPETIKNEREASGS